MDPVPAHVIRVLLSLVFLVACVHKLVAPRAFVDALRGYALVPDSVAPWLAVPIVAAEFCAGLGLLVTKLQHGATWAALALLVLYAAAMTVNLLRGRRDIDCGCAGAGARQTLSGWLVVRNLLLAAALGATLAPVSERALAPFDFFTIAAGAAALYALYAASNLLIAYAPRTKALLG